jgi:hypothetical protein
MTWGIYIKKHDSWLLDGHDKLKDGTWKPKMSKYKTKKAATNDCSWLNKLHKEELYKPKRITNGP